MLWGLISLVLFQKEGAVLKWLALMKECQLAKGKEDQGSAPGKREQTQAQKPNTTLLY